MHNHSESSHLSRLLRLKLAALNLADHRSITSITGPTAADFYTFQAGREVTLTLQAKFP